MAVGTRRLLAAQARTWLLHPTAVERSGVLYYLLPRDYDGDEVKLYARRLALVAASA